jgi:hypothetical protein
MATPLHSGVTSQCPIVSRRVRTVTIVLILRWFNGNSVRDIAFGILHESIQNGPMRRLWERVLPLYGAPQVLARYPNVDAATGAWEWLEIEKVANKENAFFVNTLENMIVFVTHYIVNNSVQ